MAKFSHALLVLISLIIPMSLCLVARPLKSNDLDIKAHHVEPPNTKRWIIGPPRTVRVPQIRPIRFYDANQVKSYADMLKNKLFIKTTPGAMFNAMRLGNHPKSPAYMPLKIGSHSLPHGQHAPSDSDTHKLAKRDAQDVQSQDSQAPEKLAARMVDYRPYPFRSGFFGLSSLKNLFRRAWKPKYKVTYTGFTITSIDLIDKSN
ncbi:hypothetical protein CDD81_260 [Ophiocordyceps australis]|uniref:Uncharacterized protein n=1 Tax=Ophiocordyceps australis TaxID=1399860 RepID=A0A2C5YBV8_9HYPO|nr:hypothetical protein CDD81_260 [Ophiocordyceps australis]